MPTNFNWNTDEEQSWDDVDEAVIHETQRWRPPRWLLTGGLVLAAGVLLFAGDLAARHFLGHKLFPMAAPAGGIAMMIGWLIVGLSALVRR